MGKKNMFDIFRMKSQFSNSVKNKIDTFFEGRIDQDQTIAGVDQIGGDIGVSDKLNIVSNLKWLMVEDPWIACKISSFFSERLHASSAFSSRFNHNLKSFQVIFFSRSY